MGLITAFIIAPFIRSLMDFSLGIELLITTSFIIPMYAVVTKLFKKYL